MNHKFILFSLLALLQISCDHRPKGEKLAIQYCGSCHAFPEPSLLDKTTWGESVLPEMAFRMGLANGMLMNIPYRDISQVRKTLPARPMVTEEEWLLIEEYFIKNAPDSLRRPKKVKTDSITQFSVKTIAFTFYPNPLVTTLAVDTLSHNVVMGDRLSVLYQFDKQFNLQEYFQLKSPPSHIIPRADGKQIVSLMGIMEPNDQAFGEIVSVNGKFSGSSPLLDSLQRPVHFQRSDLNNDGKEDFLICAFGNFTGGLLAFEDDGNSYIEHLVSPLPGARKVIAKDVNADGLKDVIVLFTQGQEKISLFINQGNFQFKEEVLLNFPPVFGSSYFEIADFNSDGHFDILYTNGDNADYSETLKPYHSVKLFINDGKMEFDEFWSFPMYGASQAMARDFDKDGDLDIVAISFFPDFESFHQESLIYFENQGDNHFRPQTTPLAEKGRWLVMEVGDYDDDGDEDVVIGAHNLQPNSDLAQKWSKDPVAILLLKNNTTNKDQLFL